LNILIKEGEEIEQLEAWMNLLTKEKLCEKEMTTSTVDNLRGRKTKAKSERILNHYAAHSALLDLQSEP
jgi:hypothetical protein